MVSDSKAFFSKSELKEILVGAHYVDEQMFQKVADQAETDKHILDTLFAEGALSKDLWGQALAEFFEVVYADLNSYPPTKETVLRLPEDVAREHRVVIFDENENTVIFSTDAIEKNKGTVDELQDLFPNKKIVFALSLSDDVDRTLLLYRKPLQQRLSSFISASNETVPEILKEILSEAQSQNASDVHFEPIVKQDLVTVRLRIDGVLQKLAELPATVYENLLNRIKVLSDLRIDEHQRVQDGALRFSIDTKDIDIRVSIAPTVAGEKITLRILSEYIESFSPEVLGMSAEQVSMLKQIARKPFGMVVICGPTGSGKTTTAYTLLSDISNETINVTTIEDPVEYRMRGINQIQVRPEAGINFAAGLRSIVRQDPDVIFVGEIRDKETAEIAVNAALTGHLLMSTFHATSASTTIPRLLEMEVEPFLLASTLSVVVAQRLVRKLCESCRYSEQVNRKDLDLLFEDSKSYFNEEKVTLYKSKGCPACNGTGFQGRTVVVEILEINEAIRTLITSAATAKQIESQARQDGMSVLFEDGIKKVKAGVTSLAELFRVVEEPGK